MAHEDQAQADLQTETTVADPSSDVANLPTGTTTPLASYEDQVRAAMEQEEVEDPQELEQSAIEEEDEVLPDPDEASEESFEEEEADEPSAKTQERFRFKSEEDKAVAAIAKAKDCSLVEAARIYSGDQPQSRATESTQEQESAPSESVSSVMAEIADLRLKYKEATKAIDVDEQAELFEQLEEKRDHLAKLKVTEAEQSARAAQTKLEKDVQVFDSTWDKCLTCYPDLNDPNGAMYKEVARLHADMKEMGDPLADDPAILWELSTRAGLNTRTPMRKTREQSSAPAKGRTGSPVQPASGNRGTTTTDPSKRAAEVIAGIKTADDYERIVASLG